MINENIKLLMEETGCEEQEATAALELAGGNIEQAIINVGVMLKYITAYKAKIKLKNDNIFGLVHIITNNKNLDLLKFSSIMSYNPVVYEQDCSADWFSFEKAIYSYRLIDGVIEKYTRTIDISLKDFTSANLKQHKILTVNDMKNVLEEFFLDNNAQIEIVAEELTLRDFKKLPNYFPDIHFESSGNEDTTIDLEAVILEDSEGKKIEDISVGDNVLAKIIDERDISHYLGHLIGAMKDNKMIPVMVSVQNIIKQEDHYDVYLKYADLIYGISKVEFGRTLKVLETKRLPWWKGLTTIVEEKTT